MEIDLKNISMLFAVVETKEIRCMLLHLQYYYRDIATVFSPVVTSTVLLRRAQSVNAQP